MAAEPRSLKATFMDAERKRLSLEGVYDTQSPTYQSTVTSAILDYQACQNLVSALSLFSPNESAEDISTSNLPYLLIDHHLATLLQKQQTPTPSARKLTLQATRAAYERLLHLLDTYSLLTPAQTKLLESYTDAPLAFSTTGPVGGDATARRNAKIANFKEEKALRTKLEFLRQRPEYASFDDDEDGYGKGGGGGVGGPDEEAVRAVHLAHVTYAAHMAFQGLEGLNREREMLAQAPDPEAPVGEPGPGEEEDRRRRARERGDGGYSERLDMLGRAGLGRGGPLLSKDGKPLQPFTLLGNRQEIAAGVFRPGHNLPTMTIDEYLEEERRQGNIIEGGGEASGRIPEPDEDNIEKADAETMKAREWDEFKEANPRGSGNTLNRG